MSTATVLNGPGPAHPTGTGRPHTLPPSVTKAPGPGPRQGASAAEAAPLIGIQHGRVECDKITNAGR